MVPRSEKRFDIVGIGVSVWDTVLLIDSYPDPGSVVRAKQRVEGIGGGVAVAMATAGRLGSSVAMIDSLGDDEAAARIIAPLQRAGVDTTAITRQENETTSSASIWTDVASGERTIVYSPGSASERLCWTAEIDRLVRDARIVHLNGRHADVCLQLISFAKSVGTKISFDGGAYRYREEVLPMLRATDIAIVARQFAQAHYQRCTGRADLLAAARLCDFLKADLSCEIVGVTDGANGSHLIDRAGESLFQPAIRPDLAVDTTGCGDTYHGAFLHGIAAGNDVKTSAEIAAEVSSQNARALGAFSFTSP